MLLEPKKYFLSKSILWISKDEKFCADFEIVGTLAEKPFMSFFKNSFN